MDARGSSREPDAPAALRSDDAAWNAFVSGANHGTIHQLTPWAQASAGKGWRAIRVATDSDEGPIGAQILVHRMRPGPWSRGYATRGPVAAQLTEGALRVFTAELRRDARRHRLTHVYMDPELPRGGLEGRLLLAQGWRRAPHVQPNQSRIVDLARTEEQLWGDLRTSARWSVNKARRNGLEVVETRAEGLAEFVALFDETVERIGPRLIHHSNVAAVFGAFDAIDAARILLARDPDGQAVATLMLIACGRRMFELYGAASAAGFKARANYLVKWEAIRRSRERGFVSYDMWGTDLPNLAEFKAGFGGEERFYDGAFELVTEPVGRLVVGGVQRLRGLVARGQGRRTSNASSETVTGPLGTGEPR